MGSRVNEGEESPVGRLDGSSHTKFAAEDA